ncbi:hypothetical protein AAIB33_03410 [Microbacterium sp. AZCO]|uniref:hypothetical protein n=1 Tax=Microbacterium sp. AZCO TaxID=3142976 RepID=UPI0031F42ECE
MDHPDPQSDARADLVSALEVIEDQPLHTRAAAYEALNESLARQLDSGPTVARA